MAGTAIRVDGLADLRKSVRALDKGALKEVQLVSKRAAEVVAVKARQNAPHRSGKLAGSIKATTSGHAGIVRSPLPYAAVQEYGGTIRPKGAPVKIARHLFVGHALDSESDKVLQALADGFDALLRSNGWK